MSTLKVNTINEQTAAAGVTVDGALLKDGALTLPGTGTATTTLAIAGTSAAARIELNGAAASGIIDNLDGNLNFRASGATIGFYSQGGQWTLGPATGGDFSHIFRTGSTTDLAPIQAENTASTSSYVKFTTSGTARGWIGSGSTGPLFVLNELGSERLSLINTNNAATQLRLSAQSTSFNNAVEFNDSSAVRFAINHDNNATSTSQVLRFSTDTQTNAFRMANDGSILVGSPTGGFQGTGTINAVSVYDDGALLTDYVFEKYYDGKPVDDKHSDYQMNTLSEEIEFTRNNKHLSTIVGRAEWEAKGGKVSVGRLVNDLWETVETQFLYIKELHERIEQLEQA